MVHPIRRRYAEISRQATYDLLKEAEGRGFSVTVTTSSGRTHVHSGQVLHVDRWLLVLRGHRPILMRHIETARRTEHIVE